MSKSPFGAMIVLSAALTACSDHRPPELVTRSAPMPVTMDSRAGHEVATVYFAFDGFELDPQARSVLDAEAVRMSGRVREEFIVTGHADRIGSPEYNFDLGMRRALSVVNYLVSKGVARERLVPTVSYGELSPVLAVDHAERLNRRVVILPKEPSQPVRVVVQEDGNPAAVRLASLSNQSQIDGQPATGGTTDLPGEPGPSGEDTPAQPGNSGQAPQAPGSSERPPQEPGSDPSENAGSGAGSNENTGPAEGAGNEQSNGPGNGSSSGNNGQGPGQNSGQGNGSGGSQESGSGNDSNGNNQSGTRTDAGRGNGAEDGDPGNSGGRNNGGDDD